MISFIAASAILIQSTLVITSSSFNDGEMIPPTYTCDGKNISPELAVTEVPEGTKTLVVIMVDPDAPGGNMTHWVAFDIIPGGKIKEDAEPGVKGLNGKGTLGYTGPCPSNGIHHYHFTVYALDIILNLKEGASRELVEDAMKDHVLASGDITGIYQRK